METNQPTHPTPTNAGQRYIDADTIRTITQHGESGKIALPKRELKDKFGIELEDYYGEQVPIEIDTDRNAIIIDLPLDQ